MSLPSPVHITTARLVLTMPGRQDAPKMVDYFERNREHLGRWEPRRPRSFFTPSFWEKRLEDNRQELIDDQALRLVLFERGDATSRVAGIVNFTAIVRGVSHCTSLGYSLDRERQGAGLMHEALTASIQHVFEELRLHRIQANYQPDNHRSGRLLRDLGFCIEGFARDYLLIDGQWRDHILTSLTNAAFDAKGDDLDRV